jgi:hypothetical protein
MNQKIFSEGGAFESDCEIFPYPCTDPSAHLVRVHKQDRKERQGFDD